MSDVYYNRTVYNKLKHYESLIGLNSQQPWHSAWPVGVHAANSVVAPGREGASGSTEACGGTDAELSGTDPLSVPVRPERGRVSKRARERERERERVLTCRPWQGRRPRCPCRPGRSGPPRPRRPGRARGPRRHPSCRQRAGRHYNPGCGGRAAFVPGGRWS